MLPCGALASTQTPCDTMSVPLRRRGCIDSYQTSTGRWRHRVRLTVHGQLRTLDICDTAEQAERTLAASLLRLDGQLDGLSLAQWGERWLDRREKDKIHRSTKSARSVWKARIAIAPFADWPLRRIQHTDVVRWVRKLLCSPAQPGHKHKTTPTRTLSRQSVLNALSLLRVALADAADEGHLQGNPAAAVRVPRVATTEEGWTYLTADEIAAVLELPVSTDGRGDKEHIRLEQRVAITVAIYTGLRAGELWGLRWGDVQLRGDRPELVVRHSYRGPTKGGKVRRVPLLPPAREALKKWRARRPGVADAFVFAAAGGGCHTSGYDAAWGRVRRLTGIREEVVFHSLRHTCASHLVMGTWGRPWRLEEVRQMLGHSSITVTERYAHLAPEGLHAAAAATARIEDSGC